MGLDFIPLWVFFIGTIVIILLSLEAGFLFGRRVIRRFSDEKESPTAAMGGAVLGLVAFLLAFTFGIAAARFDTRKQLVRDDANSIRTAYLRADFMPDPDRTEFRRVLKDYLDLRIDFAHPKDFQKHPEVMAKVADMQGQLWDYVVAHGRTDLDSDIGALVVESVNEMINVHALRVAVAIETRIPMGIWMIMYGLSVLGMVAMGYQAGIAGSRRSHTIIVLAVSFALVMTLIEGLDRPNTPLVSVTQQPLIDVQGWIEATQGGSSGEHR
ncbi:MAG: hypothetical protein L0Y44_02495 [Phycisphaerales bacterium]|nr:hypothetical protein [Phycisphaerales bacterium]MCI0674725.1 hypothetical protein [Phycisphaerales bacterium]